VHYHTFSFIAYSEVRDGLRQTVDELVKSSSVRPNLRIVQVGDREDSAAYIIMKLKAAREIGIGVEHVRLPKSTTEAAVRDDVPRAALLNLFVLMRRMLMIRHVLIKTTLFFSNTPKLSGRHIFPYLFFESASVVHYPSIIIRSCCIPSKC
jgi:hypothetical protein